VNRCISLTSKAIESNFYTTLLGRKIDDLRMVWLPDPLPTATLAAVKIGHPAEIADRTLSVKIRKAYIAPVTNTTIKLGKFYTSGRAPSDATLRRSRISACYETTSYRSWSSTKDEYKHKMA
jgi:hypothetical protein